MNRQEVFKTKLKKPDGRDLTLYSRRPIDENIVATSPSAEASAGNPHLRWHPLREEWVAYASHRQNRTFLPPKEYNPLAPTKSAEFPTELPAGDYDVAVFDNLFASLVQTAGDAPPSVVPVAPGRGHCEVVVFTRDSETSLGKLPADHIRLMLEVWADRCKEIASKDGIQYILPFENRGVEVGVTLHHPHGQIYSYPFIPPLQRQMLASQKNHWLNRKTTLIGDMLADELKDGRRVIHRGRESSAFIPACARYPYEVWIVPHRPVTSLTEMTSPEFSDLARTLKTVLLKYDGLWERPFPYLMALYAAPTDGEPHDEWHFHIEFYPPYRSKERLKFLAGTELAAGMFVNDSLPEEKARELQQVEVNFE